MDLTTRLSILVLYRCPIPRHRRCDRGVTVLVDDRRDHEMANALSSFRRRSKVVRSTWSFH